MIKVLILLSAIPIGIWIAWLCKEELKEGRKYFRILIIVGLIGAIGFWLYDRSVWAWSSAYIAIVSLMSLILAVRNGEGRFLLRKRV